MLNNILNVWDFIPYQKYILYFIRIPHDEKYYYMDIEKGHYNKAGYKYCIFPSKSLDNKGNAEHILVVRIHFGAPPKSWYFEEHFWHAPLAVGLILQLVCGPIGNRNLPKKTKENFATEGTPHIVFSCVVSSDMHCTIFLFGFFHRHVPLPLLRKEGVPPRARRQGREAGPLQLGAGLLHGAPGWQFNRNKFGFSFVLKHS